MNLRTLGLIIFAVSIPAMGALAGKARPNPKFIERITRQLENQKVVLEKWNPKPPLSVDDRGQRPELPIAAALDELPEVLTKSVWGYRDIRVVPAVLWSSLDRHNPERHPDFQLAKFFDQLAGYYQEYGYDVLRIPCKRGSTERIGPFGYSAYTLNLLGCASGPEASGYLSVDRSNLGFKPAADTQELFLEVRRLTDQAASEVIHDFFDAIEDGEEDNLFIEDLSRFFGRADEELEFPEIDKDLLFVSNPS